MQVTILWVSSLAQEQKTARAMTTTLDLTVPFHLFPLYSSLYELNVPASKEKLIF